MDEETKALCKSLWHLRDVPGDESVPYPGAQITTPVDSLWGWRVCPSVWPAGYQWPLTPEDVSPGCGSGWLQLQTCVSLYSTWVPHGISVPHIWMSIFQLLFYCPFYFYLVHYYFAPPINAKKFTTQFGFLLRSINIPTISYHPSHPNPTHIPTPEWMKVNLSMALAWQFSTVSKATSHMPFSWNVSHYIHSSSHPLSFRQLLFLKSLFFERRKKKGQCEEEE